MMKIIIAIDGFSSCGKSTLAKELAIKLNYVFIDTGAMYRAISYYFMENRIDIENSVDVSQALGNINLSFRHNDSIGYSEIFLNESNVESAIRSIEVSNFVSKVAAVEAVRYFAVKQQQGFSVDKGIVMDGRDIGTVVFPDAELKIFLTAKPDIRVERRYKQLVLSNSNITKEEIKKNLEMRDYADTHRAVSPLVKAEDAIELDNSYMTHEEQLEFVLALAKDRIKE